MTPFAVHFSSIGCCSESSPSDMHILLLLAASVLHAESQPPAPTGTRLKELVSFEGMRDNQLLGYGLVVGLAGTGDRRQTVFSAQSLANILARMGVTISPTAIRVNNTAARSGE